MIRLETPIHSKPGEARATAASFEPIPDNGICARLGDKWTVQVVWHLSRAPDRRLRFSAIKNALDGITQRMLTLTLRNLERDGFVARHYFPEVPPRVEYELTEIGAGILSALASVNAWVRENLPRIGEHRRAYDQAER